MVNKIHGKGGVLAYLGTGDIKAVSEEAEKGNKNISLSLTLWLTR